MTTAGEKILARGLDDAIRQRDDARTELAAARAENERLRSRLDDAARLHTGFHGCVGGYYTDGEKYEGTIAKRGKCPTRRALLDGASS